MIQFILGLGAMLIVAFLFTKIRGFIFKRAKSDIPKMVGSELSYLSKIMDISKAKQIFEQLKKKFPNASAQEVEKDIDKALEATRFNSSIGKSFKKGKEVFSWTKFKKIFDLGSLVEWVKSLKELGILDVRKWVIIGVIVGGVYGYAYFQGRANTPVQILDYATEFRLNINGEYLHKPKFSNDLYLKDTETNKIIKSFYAKDFPLLAKKLKPIGLILEPIFVAGLGAGGDKNGFEAGAGVSFIKYWRYKLDAFLPNRGVYVGTHYQITDNSGLGLGVGKGFDASNRMILYYKFKF